MPAIHTFLDVNNTVPVTIYPGTAEIIGKIENDPIYGTTIGYRLSQPLPGFYPDWRNVAVRVRTDGTRDVFRCAGYQKQDGTWSLPPNDRSLIACYQPLLPAALALAEEEIAAANATWWEQP